MDLHPYDTVRHDNPMFHVSKLKSFKTHNKRPKKKHEYHKMFNLMEHWLVVKIE